MKYSIINVYSDPSKPLIAGTWLQGVLGLTFEQAIERVKGTYEANGKHLTLALVEGDNFPKYDIIINLKPLHLIEGTDKNYIYSHDGRVL